MKNSLTLLKANDPRQVYFGVKHIDKIVGESKEDILKQRFPIKDYGYFGFKANQYLDPNDEDSFDEIDLLFGQKDLYFKSIDLEIFERDSEHNNNKQLVKFHNSKDLGYAIVLQKPRFIISSRVYDVAETKVLRFTSTNISDNFSEKLEVIKFFGKGGYDIKKDFFNRNEFYSSPSKMQSDRWLLNTISVSHLMMYELTSDSFDSSYFYLGLKDILNSLD